MNTEHPEKQYWANESRSFAIGFGYYLATKCLKVPTENKYWILKELDNNDDVRKYEIETLYDFYIKQMV